MAPRAQWKGYLRLSLVSCPIALYPASLSSEKLHFNQINKNTGHRIRMLKVDAETGDPVENADIVKGDRIDADRYVEVTPDELGAVQVDSTRTIDIEQFVPRGEIDDLYIPDPYYVAPADAVGAQAFAVIREAIRKKGMVAALHDIIRKKSAGQTIAPAKREKPSNVINLMDALRKRVEAERGGGGYMQRTRKKKPPARSASRRKKAS